MHWVRAYLKEMHRAQDVGYGDQHYRRPNTWSRLVQKVRRLLRRRKH